MPEVVRGATRLVLVNHSGGGFFIRRARVAWPGAVVVKGGVKPLARQALTPFSNKENVPPARAVKTSPKRRSPLPDWYPRTPLRDITTVVKALERSRLEHAAAPQQIQWSEDPTTPVQAEQGVPQSTPLTQETLAVVASGPTSTQVAANPITLLAEDKLKSSSSPSDCSLQTAPSKTNGPARADLEKELSTSIEQIEKIISRNLKKAPKAAQPSKVTVQRRTLMSMR